ncbi:uncharacterized protein MELLADRAFT_71337 [Melampsora larici-populina 98AG31]|uniref:Uncharacterized protein n=1 Tax=Melampsora larici-populina (strain 98AG31 / pathotype 3-4-7) TaxID=747676 RepID=F4RFC3_MELLP|nr:uncharacterized protein MELLADRAFT_71337 [Melampsora larici-populina 98AG31]EGG08962.1 hypothetical protein MELLADRAFT_71337 [Melampsora larici-populina 98AG31]
MFIGFDVPPDSTVVNWEEIRNYGLMNISPHPSRSQKMRFRLLAGGMVIMTLLYTINLFKAMIDKQLWFFKTDKLGYCRPNIHTLLPLLSCIECMLVFVSIVLLERDYQGYLHVSTVFTLLLSYTFLHFGIVTRTWRILASLPRTSIELGDNQADHRSSISPRKFNTLICLLYFSFPVVFIPLHIWMSLNSSKVGRLWFQVMPVLDNLILFNQGTMSQSQIQELSGTAEGMLNTVQNPYILAILLWRIASGIYMLFITAEIAVFTYASIRLLKALGKRLRVISHAKANAAQLATIDIHMQASLVNITEVSHQTLDPSHPKKNSGLVVDVTYFE